MRIRIIFLLLLLLPYVGHSQTADEIIKRYVKYIGGEKKWKKIKTLTTTGEYNYGGIPFPFQTYAKTPNLYKFVVPFNGKYYAQGFDGRRGWKIDAFKNETTPSLLEGKEALAMANEADVELEDPFIDYSEKGHRALLEGKVNLDSLSCFKINFIRNNGETEMCYFNEKNFELVMKTAVSKNVELEGVLLNTTYTDYRLVESIRIPFKRMSEVNGQTILTIKIDTVVINAAIDNKEFQP